MDNDKNSDKQENRRLALNIVSTRTTHRGFGQGAIDLSNLSSVIIDGDEAYIDIGALHAKSRVERGIKFSPNKEDVPNGRQVWLVWVAVDRSAEGAFYGGVTACEMLIDSEARRGWKILADHVNRMDYALKRRYMVDELGDKQKKLLKDLLISHNADWWERSPQELKDKLG